MPSIGPTVEMLKLEKEEVKLLKLIRALDFGSLEISVQNGRPVLIKQMTKSIKL